MTTWQYQAALVLVFAVGLAHAEPTRLTAEQAAVLFAAPRAAAPVFTDDADLIAAVTPAVVSVFPARIVDDKDAANPLDQFFNRDRSDPKNQDKGNRDNERVQGVGSGVVLSPDGWIVTNSHVVHFNNGKLADAISVEFADRRRMDAEIVGVDPSTDLALLKVTATGLACLRIADSDKVRVGHPVYAVGNPFKIGITATKGMVSALRRSNLDLTTNGGYESYIQTDAAINPGNSGGALADQHGHLIGINTAIWAAGGRFNIGIGFAIPANLVRNVLSQLAESGKVERGFFGWQIGELSRKDIEAAGLVSMAGARLEEVMDSGPAAGAGFKAGDIVLEAAGQQVITRGDLRFIASLVKPGGALPVVYQRSGKKLNSTLIATRNEPKVADAKAALRIESLPGIDLRQGAAGIIIDKLSKELSAKTGLSTGMEITEINGKRITTAGEVEAAFTHGVNRVKTRLSGEEHTLALRLPLAK